MPVENNGLEHCAGVATNAVAVAELPVVFAPMVAGRRALDNVPVVMFEALVVSVVAEAAKFVPLVFVQSKTPVLTFKLQSPVREKAPNAPELLYCSCPFVPAGLLAGAACQVPLPDQKVFEDAPAPPLRLFTGRFPVTPLARFINGNRAAGNVPEVMFEALVVSVVAEAAKAVPLVLVQVNSPLPTLTVQSPLRVKAPNDPPLLY